MTGEDHSDFGRHGDLVAGRASWLTTLGRDLVWVLALLAAVWVVATTWAAALVACAFTGHDPLPVVDVVQLLATMWTRPRQPLSGVDETLTLSGWIWFPQWAAAVLAVPVTLWRVSRRRRIARVRARDGWARHDELEEKLGRSATVAQITRFRPDLAGTSDPLSVAVELGHYEKGNCPLFATVEESIVVISPPRSGKSSQVGIPMVLGFGGPAVITSTKKDLLQATWEHRSRLGPTWVIDVAGTTRWPDLASWCLSDGCTDVKIAQDRAGAMIGAVGGASAVENGGYWEANAKGLLSCWLAAAAHGGLGAEAVLRWSQLQTTREPIEILEQAGEAALARQLNGFVGAEERAKSGFWTMAALPLGGLLQPLAGHALGARPREGINLNEFFEQNGTIYLVASEGESSPLRGLLTALVDAIRVMAMMRAQHHSTGRLQPPVLMMLDEAANICPLPALPGLMSVSGSQSLLIVVVMQSKIQAIRAWGAEGLRMMFAAARLKILLGGQGDTEELDDWSKLIGQRDAELVSTTYSESGVSSSAQLQLRDIMSPSKLRQLPERLALVVYGSLPPAIIRQERAHEGRHAAVVASSTTLVDAIIDRGHL
jgi:type IV secretory pathway TraG/TraD family ATPase VirD4